MTITVNLQIIICCNDFDDLNSLKLIGLSLTIERQWDRDRQTERERDRETEREREGERERERER